MAEWSSDITPHSSPPNPPVWDQAPNANNTPQASYQSTPKLILTAKTAREMAKCQLLCCEAADGPLAQFNREKVTTAMPGAAALSKGTPLWMLRDFGLLY